MSQQQNSKILKDFYNSVAATYDDLIEQSKYFAPQWLTKVLPEHLQENIFVIDIGCGNGLLSKIIKGLLKNGHLLRYRCSRNSHPP